MSAITRCTQISRTARALPATTMIKIMAAMMILLAFGIAHLHLRFNLNKLRRETMQLQLLQGTLQSENNALIGKIEALKHPDRLLEYARGEIGMVAYSPTERETMRLDRDINARYAMARAAKQEVGPRRESDERELWLAAVGERMGIIGQAQANEKMAKAE